MLLIFDTGISNTKIAIYDGNELLYKWKIINKQIKNLGDLKIVLSQLFDLDNFTLKNIKFALMATQNCFIKNILIEFLKEEAIQYFECENKDIDYNIKSRYLDKNELSSDIICNIIAGNKKFKEDFLIIDMGTTTTFTIVGKNGEHLGEVITSGLETMKNSMQNEELSRMKFILQNQDTIISTENFKALNGGLYYGYLGLIKEIVKKIKSEYKEIKIVCLTGGNSSLFIHDLKLIDYVVPDLTIDGIIEIWKNNKNNLINNV